MATSSHPSIPHLGRGATRYLILTLDSTFEELKKLLYERGRAERDGAAVESYLDGFEKLEASLPSLF
jgi:hypothetical protein